LLILPNIIAGIPVITKKNRLEIASMSERIAILLVSAFSIAGCESNKSKLHDSQVFVFSGLRCPHLRHFI
jgi:hypothetical protein